MVLEGQNKYYSETLSLLNDIKELEEKISQLNKERREIEEKLKFDEKLDINLFFALDGIKNEISNLNLCLEEKRKKVLELSTPASQDVKTNAMNNLCDYGIPERVAGIIGK